MQIWCASFAFYIFDGTKFFDLFPSDTTALSVPMVRGVPLSEQDFIEKFFTVRVSVFSQICAVGHLLKRSRATKIYTSPRVLDLIGQRSPIGIFGSVRLRLSAYILRTRYLCFENLICLFTTGVVFRFFFYLAIHSWPPEDLHFVLGCVSMVQHGDD